MTIMCVMCLKATNGIIKESALSVLLFSRQHCVRGSSWLRMNGMHWDVYTEDHRNNIENSGGLHLRTIALLLM